MTSRSHRDIDVRLAYAAIRREMLSRETCMPLEAIIRTTLAVTEHRIRARERNWVSTPNSRQLVERMQVCCGGD